MCQSKMGYDVKINMACNIIGSRREFDGTDVGKIKNSCIATKKVLINIRKG